MKLNSLARAVEYLKEIGKEDCEMYLAMMRVLLLIANEPGITPGEIARKLEMADSTTTRASLRLQESRSSKHPGLGLICEVLHENEDLRVKSLQLTPKGKDLMKRLEALP